MALSEYLELTWRKKNSLARRYLHFPIALLAQFDLDHVPSVFPRQFEMHERANPLDMTDNGLDGWSPITVAFDLNIIGTHIAHGRNILSIGAQVQGVVAVWEDFLRRQVAGLCRPGDIRYDATSRPTCRKGASWR